MKHEIINELKEQINKLNARITNLTKDNAKLKKINTKNETSIKNLELKINRLDQYGRRDNLEIAGIPDSVRDDNLEAEVIKLFSEVDVVVESGDIVACHRLPKKKDSPLPK